MIVLILRKQDGKETLGKGGEVVKIVLRVSGIIGSVIGTKIRVSINWKTESVNDTICLIGKVFIIGIAVIGLRGKKIVNEKGDDRSGRYLCNKTGDREIGWMKYDDERDLFQRQINRQYHQTSYGEVTLKKRQCSQIIAK